ncbi:MAG: MFS transporter [Desulfovibrio sp.]|nr:MFS transporter [Desulfovibrio sp.]
MRLSAPLKNFYSCLFFFVCAGAAYGQFTARIPAIKTHAGINDAELGLVLLVFGVGSIAGFLSAPALLKRLPSRHMLVAAALGLLLALTGIALAPDFFGLCWVAVGFGLCTAIFDVCINVQGMLLERIAHRSRMATLHACYSIGGFLGSMSGSAFAYANIGIFCNFLSISVALAPVVILSGRHLLPDVSARETKKARRKIPFFIIFCGLMALGAFIAEGASAEWGGLLLKDVKGADAGTAALCFGALSAPMAFARLTEDRLRERFGDFALLFAGGLLAFAGLGLVLLSPLPWLCLGGFALMGLGLSPIMPVVISRAGAHGSLPPASASALVSLLGYGGLLVVPPSLGWLAQHLGLETAMFVPLLVCAALTCGSVRFR